MLDVGDQVRPRGVKARERGRSWVGTVTHVREDYPRGSDTPYRTLTVESELGEVWIDDQREWLPAYWVPREHIHVAGIRIGWYDVLVWAGVGVLAALMFATFPCGVILFGVPIAFIVHGWHGDRVRENSQLAERGNNGS